MSLHWAGKWRSPSAAFEDPSEFDVLATLPSYSEACERLLRRSHLAKQRLGGAWHLDSLTKALMSTVLMPKISEERYVFRIESTRGQSLFYPPGADVTHGSQVIMELLTLDAMALADGIEGCAAVEPDMTAKAAKMLRESALSGSARQLIEARNKFQYDFCGRAKEISSPEFLDCWCKRSLSFGKVKKSLDHLDDPVALVHWVIEPFNGWQHLMSWAENNREYFRIG